MDKLSLQNHEHEGHTIAIPKYSSYWAEAALSRQKTSATSKAALDVFEKRLSETMVCRDHHLHLPKIPLPNECHALSGVQLEQGARMVYESMFQMAF